METADLLSLAVQHHRAGRLSEAEALYIRILELDANQSDALHLLGVLNHQRGRHEPALELIQRALTINNTNAECHTHLANVLCALGRSAEAIAAYGRAIELEPTLLLAHLNLGALLQGLGRLEEAVLSYERALRFQPDYAEAHYNLATALKDLGRMGEAVSALRQAVAIKPDYAHAQLVLAGYLLERHDFGSALETCERCLQLAPQSIQALAFKSIALGELGQHEHVGALVDFDRLIAGGQIDVPAGFKTVADFNAALVRHVRMHPSLIENPATGATRLGSHTDELLVEPKGPFAFFEQIVNEAVQHYLKVLPKDAEHPYLAFRPQRWQLAVWGVILGAQGHQVPHIHPDAWVSGVYYASLPPIVSRAGESCAGWIEFGQPPAEFRAGGRHAVRAIQPEEGLMLLFPSYFYHRTIPYASEGERVSIAFDVVPRADH